MSVNCVIIRFDLVKSGTYIEIVMLFFHNQQLIEQYAMAVPSKPKEFSFSITVTSQWALWRLKSPAYELFIQPFVLTHSKENIEAPRHWPLWGESTGHQWIPLTKGQ